ncbi:hypothetical protein AB6B37_05775 [Fretibacter rubidus]|uniref:hypothetical protein n=1 Tax=Fretibacter rubidus TaxID=570162 RepID=UPI003A67FEE9
MPRKVGNKRHIAFGALWCIASLFWTRLAVAAPTDAITAVSDAVDGTSGQTLKIELFAQVVETPPSPTDVLAPTDVNDDAMDTVISGPRPKAVPPIILGQETDEPETILPGRRIPGRDKPLPTRERLFDPAQVPPPQPATFPTDEIPLPDRWRLIENLGVNERWWDPYNQNTLKGDRPLKGTKDWFFVATGISDTIVEPRTFPIPVGVQTTERRSDDLFGDPDTLLLAQTFIASGALIKGNTTFKPQDYEYRLTAALNINHARVNEKRILFVEPSKGITRTDVFLGIQEAFFDYHIRNVSDRYDFDSVRVGIQPFSSDFRGFLFQDSQPGIRFFGNRDNNRYQYNLAAFMRLEKDTNSGLNAILRTPRRDLILLANLYRQDFPVPGLTSQVTAIYNGNREGSHTEIDTNGFPVRPALIGNLRGRDYDVGYVGYNVDGRYKRLNITGSTYYAFGQDRDNIFTGKSATISAGFAAVEASYDYNWMRFRASGLYATGDADPYDNVETGFDAIFENPQFAGADTSYWIRQNIPFIGGGRAIGVSGRNGILNSLRSSKEQGQSNFNNPGTILIGAGADFDITPEWRLSFNANALRFDKTAILEALRVQGGIDKDIGLDLSASAIWRPKMTQNIVLRGSIASLEPGGGFDDLFTNNQDDNRYLSVLLNATLTY